MQNGKYSIETKPKNNSFPSSADAELYKESEKDRKNFKDTEEEPAVSVDILSTGQLLGIIKDDLSEFVPDAWDSLILKITIGKEDGNQSIETHFFYQLDGKEIQFEPENPITSMNALLTIQERMAEEGNNWNKSTIIINRDGTVDIQVK